MDASGRDFLPFTDLERACERMCKTLRESALIPDDIPIAGRDRTDVRSGRLQEVVHSDDVEKISEQ